MSSAGSHLLSNCDINTQCMHSCITSRARAAKGTAYIERKTGSCLGDGKTEFSAYRAGAAWMTRRGPVRRRPGTHLLRHGCRLSWGCLQT